MPQAVQAKLSNSRVQVARDPPRHQAQPQDSSSLQLVGSLPAPQVGRPGVEVQDLPAVQVSSIRPLESWLK